MKNIRREDKDFDFDRKEERRPIGNGSKVEYTIEPTTQVKERIRLGGITLDINEDCLILRRRTRNIKEKTMVALDQIESTKVKRVAKPGLLFLAIFFLVFCAVGAYPLYLYLNNLYLAIGVAAAGLVLFIVFLSIFLSTRRLQLIINFSTTRTIKYMIYETKMFEKLNSFLDEVYAAKHKLR